MLYIHIYGNKKRVKSKNSKITTHFNLCEKIGISVFLLMVLKIDALNQACLIFQ